MSKERRYTYADLFSDDYKTVCQALNAFVHNSQYLFNVDRISQGNYPNVAFSAIARGRLDILQLVLGDKPEEVQLNDHQRARLDTVDHMNNTMMHIATLTTSTSQERIKIMEYLHSKGLSYTILHPDGGIPLTGAAINGNRYLFDFLVKECQGDPNQPRYDGKTPSELLVQAQKNKRKPSKPLKKGASPEKKIKQEKAGVKKEPVEPALSAKM